MKELKNQHLIKLFENAYKCERIAHAYLFWGGEFDEKLKLVERLKDLLKIDDFDVIRIRPEKEEISINQIRNAKKQLSLSPFSGIYKLAVIEGAEKMNGSAANALLKLLEEPKENTILILISEMPDLLPKTIISRVQEVRFKSPSLNEVSSVFSVEQYNSILKKSVSEAFEEVEEISKDDLAVNSLLNSWLFYFRDKIMKTAENTEKKRLAAILNEIEKIKQMIFSTNLNKRLALENLILFIKEYV